MIHDGCMSLSDIVCTLSNCTLTAKTVYYADKSTVYMSYRNNEAFRRASVPLGVDSTNLWRHEQPFSKRYSLTWRFDHDLLNVKAK